MSNTDPAWEYAQNTVSKGTVHAGGKTPKTPPPTSNSVTLPLTNQELAEYLRNAPPPPPRDPDKPFPTPRLGPPVRQIKKPVPVLNAKRNALHHSTVVIDTYGTENDERVVVSWPLLEELIDEVVEYRRLIAHCRGLDES